MQILQILQSRPSSLLIVGFFLSLFAVLLQSHLFVCFSRTDISYSGLETQTLKSDLVPKPIFIHAGETLFHESVFRLANRSFGVWKSASIVARNLLFRTLCKARVLACCSLRLFLGL